MTLDRLVKVLADEYEIEVKRSTLYTRLLPRNPTTLEGKRHKEPVPIRLLRPTNDATKFHVDGQFARATIKHMKVFEKKFFEKNFFHKFFHS